VLVGLVIWDMDGFQVKDDNSDYTKTWWGNEWGGSTRSEWKAIVLSNPTSVPDLTSSETTPVQFKLHQNFPNPFNPQTVISFELPITSTVEITIYNLMGQKLRTLISDEKEAGSYHVSWDAKDDKGNLVSSGIYLYKMKAGDLVQTHKMLFIR